MLLRITTRQLCKSLPRGSAGLLQIATQKRLLATTSAPPVTQNAAGSKGPTAMVFLNMGGPSTTAEVGDFLSRLFVSGYPWLASVFLLMRLCDSLTAISSHSADSKTTSVP